MVEEHQRHRSGYGGVDLRDPNPNDSDPLGGHHMMNNQTNQFVQTRNGETVNDSVRDFWTADNPNTGTRYTSTNVDTPTWSYERSTDPSGFGQERYNNDPFTNFMMKGGGQDYDGRMDQGSGLGYFFGRDEFEDETQEEFVARVEGMERDRSNEDLYFTEFEDDVVEVLPGEMRRPQFSGSIGTQIRPFDYDDSMNFGNFYRGGIADLPEAKTEEPGMQQPKVPMTDEQKDYLFDYMMDFMMKQRAREQQEMEGRIPPFNYEGLEV